MPFCMNFLPLNCFFGGISMDTVSLALLVISIVLLGTVGAIGLWSRDSRSFPTSVKATSISPDDATQDEKSDAGSVRPSRSSIVIFLIGAYLVGLAINAETSLGLYREMPIVECLMLLVLGIWIAVSIASPESEALLRAAVFLSSVFALFFLLTLQSPSLFWIILFALTALVLSELWNRFSTEPVLTKIAQTLWVLLILSTTMLLLATYSLPTLSQVMSPELDYKILIQIRWYIVGCFAIIALLESGATVWRNYTMTYQEFCQPPNFQDFPPTSLAIKLASIFIVMFRTVKMVVCPIVNALINLLINVFRFWFMVGAELLRFVLNTFVSSRLWKALGKVTFSGVLIFVLVFEILYGTQYLYKISRSAQSILTLDLSIFVAYGVVSVFFVIAIVLVAVLAQLWQRRRSEGPASWERAVMAGTCIVLCSWGATLTYTVVNFATKSANTALVDVGLFTIVGLAGILFGSAFMFRRSPPSSL